MHKNPNLEKPEPLIDLDPPKFLVILSTILLFFVIPALGFSYLSKGTLSNSNRVEQSSVNASDGENGRERVAGVADSAMETLGLDLSNRATQFTLLGSMLIVLAFSILAYMFFTEREPNYTKSDMY